MKTVQNTEDKTTAEITASIKQRTNANKATFFVEADTTLEEIFKQDSEGKKFIFDITNFPELPPESLSKLSRHNRMAYSADARYALAAKMRELDGRSAYSEAKDELEFIDPLHAAHESNKFTIRHPKPGMKYLFPDPKRAESLLKAGYQYVKPEDSEEVLSGEKLGDKIVIKNDKNMVDHTVMRVPQKDYDKHIEFYSRESKKRLGIQSKETAERMERYAPRVNVFDSSKLTK